MTVATESGYSWTDGKHARVLHAGNRLFVKSTTASNETSAGPGAAALNSLTYEKWVPFDNEVASPFDLSGWTLTNVTVSGGTITETAATGVHELELAHTFTAAEHVMAIKIDRGNVP